jgi:hypothetical protein
VKEPETFNEARFHNDPKEKIGWRGAIEKELSDMHFKCEIWDTVAVKDITPGRKLLGADGFSRKRKMGSIGPVYVLWATIKSLV